jgi:hypothetical protein
MKYPGKFLLAYLPRKTPHHEYVTVTPEGVRYREQMFHSVNACIRLVALYKQALDYVLCVVMYEEMKFSGRVLLITGMCFKYV